MNGVFYSINRLPDLEIYGGETSPWEIEFVSENYLPYGKDDITGCLCTLVLVPYGYVTGVLNEDSQIRIVLTKTTAIARDNTTGRLYATFHFSIGDTQSLRGKYIYQIEIKQDSQLALGQGSVFIRGNLDR